MGLLTNSSWLSLNEYHKAQQCWMLVARLVAGAFRTDASLTRRLRFNYLTPRQLLNGFFKLRQLPLNLCVFDLRPADYWQNVHQ
jgi:hypothetical protein